MYIFLCQNFHFLSNFLFLLCQNFHFLSQFLFFVTIFNFLWNFQFFMKFSIFFIKIFNFLWNFQFFIKICRPKMWIFNPLIFRKILDFFFQTYVYMDIVSSKDGGTFLKTFRFPFSSSILSLTSPYSSRLANEEAKNSSPIVINAIAQLTSNSPQTDPNAFRFPFRVISLSTTWPLEPSYKIFDLKFKNIIFLKLKARSEDFEILKRPIKTKHGNKGIKS